MCNVYSNRLKYNRDDPRATLMFYLILCSLIIFLFCFVRLYNVVYDENFRDVLFILLLYLIFCFEKTYCFACIML